MTYTHTGGNDVVVTGHPITTSPEHMLTSASAGLGRGAWATGGVCAICIHRNPQIREIGTVNHSPIPTLYNPATQHRLCKSSPLL